MYSGVLNIRWVLIIGGGGGGAEKFEIINNRRGVLLNGVRGAENMINT